MAEKKKTSDPAIATNRKARHDYEIEQTLEAGIVLVGSEVKSMRGGKATLTDSYASIKNGEVFLYGLHVPEYKQASMLNHEPVRPRKLLLHAGEIAKLRAKMDQQGYTLIPLKLYFKQGKVKVEIALAKGRKRHDKREAIAKREHEREIAKHAAAVRRR